MGKQFERDYARSDEGGLLGILNRRFCDTCQRIPQRVKPHHDFDCWFEPPGLAPYSMAVEGKTDWATSENLCLEFVGGIRLDDLPVGLRPGWVKRIGRDDDEYRLVEPLIQGWLALGPGEHDNAGVLLARGIGDRHWFLYQRKRLGYSWLLRTRALIMAIMSNVWRFDVALGPVQDVYHPYRSVSLLIPEEMLEGWGVIEERLVQV
jgi:hypothetical protein